MEPVRQQPDKLDASRILIVAVVVLVIFGVGIAWAVVIQRDTVGKLNDELGPREIIPVKEDEVGNVYVKSFDTDYALHTAKKQRAHLESAGWNDKDKTTAHVPIDRAIQMFLDRGGKL